MRDGEKRGGSPVRQIPPTVTTEAQVQTEFDAHQWADRVLERFVEGLAEENCRLKVLVAVADGTVSAADGARLLGTDAEGLAQETRHAVASVEDALDDERTRALARKDANDGH